MSSQIPFILASTPHGMMIVNRVDVNSYEDGGKFGVGFELLENGSFANNELDVIKQVLLLRQQYFGNGVVAIDGGANIGVHTLEYGRLMKGWGRVLSYEVQEPVYYSLCGNVIMNNLHNVKCNHIALGDYDGFIDVPYLDYTQNASFGSLELLSHDNKDLGQNMDSGTYKVPIITIDSLQLERLDFVKLDIEGMELLVLNGMKNTIKRHKPVLFIEVIKADQRLIDFLREYNYDFAPVGINFVCIHKLDPLHKHMMRSE